MEPLLTGAIVASLALVVLLITAASRIGRHRERTIARVAVLQALAGESDPSGASGPSVPSSPEDAEDDWDLGLRADEYAAVREYNAAGDLDVVAAPVPIAPIAAATSQFVVEVPDSAAARPWQLSFEQKESRSS
jgi:hypothetical protein